MTVSFDVTPEVESRLQKEAAKRGLPAPEYARLLVEGFLTPTQAEDEQEAARLEAIDAATGAFAHIAFSSDDLTREHQTEIERDERSHRG